VLDTSVQFGGPSDGRAALIIAHPGHELCVYGWLESARPLVFVWTDGAGRCGLSRLESTTTILSRTGAERGSIYGRFTDREIYKAILNHDCRLFEQMTVELAEALAGAGITQVAGDAIEGYNPVHDVGRLVTNAAVELAGGGAHYPIINREFRLFARHEADSNANPDGALVLTLDEDQLERKLEAAQTYPELQSEVNAMLNSDVLEALQKFPDLGAHFSNVVTKNMGKEAYRVECLRTARGSHQLYGTSEEVPFYERYGKKLVAEGLYDRAITYREHIMPLAEAINSFIEGSLAEHRSNRRTI
jgi:hypothetical protein